MFVARRSTASFPNNKKVQKLRCISEEWRSSFAQSDATESQKWIACDAIELPTGGELCDVFKSDIFTLQMVQTEHPLIATSCGA